MTPTPAETARATRRLAIPADLSRVNEVREWLAKLERDNPLGGGRLFDLQVVVSEAVANAIEHAQSDVKIAAYSLPDRLIIEVTNDGAFRPGLYKDDQHRRRGLGLPLMVSLADQVHVSRLAEGKTQVSLTFLRTERVAPAEEAKQASTTSRLGRPAWLAAPLQIGPGRAALIAAAGAAAEVLLFFGVSRLGSPSRYLGIPGAAAALIGVVAAFTAGPIVGTVVALAGGVAYIAFLTAFGRSVVWPAIIGSIVLWTLASVVAGLGANWVRRRAASREILLSQSVKDRETLLGSLKISEERYRASSEENARLYQEQQKIAESLQLVLLNVPREIGRLRFGHVYRSATETAYVGGDFYDVFEAQEGQVALLIGDVAGHGVEAARAATLAKDVIHAFTHQSLRPEEVLASTNRLLIQKSLPGFVTVFLGILDIETGGLLYASAGHPAALLKRKSGVVELLGSGSPPLGVFSDATWKSAQLELRPGDLLLLYTDGIIEARRDGDFYGESRLVDLLAAQETTPEELPELILDDVLAFSGGTLLDDVAILSLSLTEDGRASGSGDSGVASSSPREGQTAG